MKKVFTLTAVLLLLAVLLAACGTTNSDANGTGTNPSQGAVQDNDIFDQENASTGATQPSTGATQPSGGATTEPATGPSTPSGEHPSEPPVTQPSVPSETQPTTPPATQPTTPPVTEPAAPEEPMTYERFQAMSGAEQRAFQESFDSMEAFFAWYNAAKEAYDKANPPIEVGGDGVVDMGGITGKEE